MATQDDKTDTLLVVWDVSWYCLVKPAKETAECEKTFMKMSMALLDVETTQLLVYPRVVAGGCEFEKAD
ncbi:MAG: hypothetical protein GX229_04490 [Syntrophomonadaceae bacterium]|nr:hypothetical protein [Syntrophomonadaceae bacterium]